MLQAPKLADRTSVNEVFDPARVDGFYDLPAETRKISTRADKATNYGVVRPELLDQLYEAMYHQRLHEPDPDKWQFRIVSWREVIGFEKCADDRRLRLRLKDTSTGHISICESGFDLVIFGTGYERKGHETLLESTRPLLQEQRFAVERNYRVKYRKDAVAENCGVWLQGCCEDTHGVSGSRSNRTMVDSCSLQLGDTLLSMLAVRGGEMVDSIFPRQTERARL